MTENHGVAGSIPALGTFPLILNTNAPQLIVSSPGALIDAQRDTAMVLQRMRLGVEAEAEVAEVMGQLLAKGDMYGKENRGDDRALDVTVSSIIEQGLRRLRQ